MSKSDLDALMAFDRQHVWHPYASMRAPSPVLPVRRAHGCTLVLEDGRELIDGMSSWWAAIHGYNHPKLNQAVQEQLDAMSHVMFGGLTHRPAVDLARALLDICPSGLEHVFFTDSGSVAVEVAIKMALQTWKGRGFPNKRRLLTVRGGYHGDTFGAMSVCDPTTGMHHLFQGNVTEQLFVPRPACAFDDVWCADAIEPFAEALEASHEEIAAVIVEPIVQGAGGMYFYHPQFLRELRTLCDRWNVLLILDEIATGFGRTGALFAAEHAGISPDIMCVGKALTGGYMTLGATLCTREVSMAVCEAPGSALMHGPTFMANPLACAVALASLELIGEGLWRGQVERIARQLEVGLAPCEAAPDVVDVRVLGAIGVIEMAGPVDVERLQPEWAARGVWLRPFGKLIYTMPPYVVSEGELARITDAITDVIRRGGVLR